MSKQILLIALFYLFAIPKIFAQVSEYRGQTSTGAYYKIEVPQAWLPEDGLVIWNHGYQGYTQTSPDSNPSLGPLADVALEQGYAIAASSFSQTGWAVFNSHIDNQQLFEKFVELVGMPDKVFIQGGSMGGIVSLRDIESGLIPNVDGALLFCGAVAGAQNWYNAFDLRMIYEAVCEDVSGAGLPTQSWYEQPSLVRGELDFLDSLERCTGLITSEQVGGVLGALLRSSDQNERLNRILDITQIDISFLLLNLGYAVFELPSLVNHPKKLNGLLPFDNAAVDYGDADINLRVKRNAALPSSRQLLLENYSPSGNIRDTKIVSIHTSRDDLVSVGNQRLLRDLIPASQLSIAVAVEEEPSHCGFSYDESLSAWNSLRSWVDGGAQPNAQDIQHTCKKNNSDTGQCRFDFSFELPSSALIFPRNFSAPTLGTNSYDSATSTISIEALKQAGEPGSYNLELVPSLQNDSVFNLGDIEFIVDVGSWQHQALFLPDQQMLYLPSLKILPWANNDPKYNVFMYYTNESGQETLKLLEFETTND